MQPFIFIVNSCIVCIIEVLFYIVSRSTSVMASLKVLIILCKTSLESGRPSKYTG